ncbi:MAG: hypothetical protein QXW58_02175 [Thermosphaera sp.]
MTIVIKEVNDAKIEGYLEEVSTPTNNSTIQGFLKDVVEVDYSSFLKQVSFAHRVNKWIASVSLAMIRFPL